jgi:hypothetical protein
MYQTLCNEDVEFSYENGGQWTRFRRRTIEVERDVNGLNQVIAVNYSPPFQGELTLSKGNVVPTSTSTLKNYSPYTAPPKVMESSPMSSHRTEIASTLSDKRHVASASTIESTSYITRLEALYRALKKFDELCEQPENQWNHLLKEGECVVFDNRRILHGRKSFRFMNEQEVMESEMSKVKGETSGKSDEERMMTVAKGAPPVEITRIRSTNRRSTPLYQATPDENEIVRGRWLKGAYLDGDELYSKWRIGEVARKKLAKAKRLDGIDWNKLQRDTAVDVVVGIGQMVEDDEKAGKAKESQL